MQPEPQPPALLSVPEAAERLHVSRHTVQRLIRSGRLRAARITEKLWRVDASDVERLATPSLHGAERERPAPAASSPETDPGLLWLAETAWAGDVPLGTKEDRRIAASSAGTGDTNRPTKRTAPARG